MALDPATQQLLDVANGDLSGYSADELAQLEQALKDAFDQADQANDTAAMADIADAIDGVRAVAGKAKTPPPSNGPGKAATASATASGADEGVPAGLDEEEEAAVMPEHVSAADVPAANRPLRPSAGQQREAVEGGWPHGLVATSGTGVAAQVFPAMTDVYSALEHAVSGMRGAYSSDDPQHSLVASLVWGDQRDESHVLMPGDLDGNSRKLRTFLSDRENLTPDGMVAAGWCAPAVPKYDVPTVGTTARPLRDSLPSFGADRGGVTWVQPPSAADVASALAQWVFMDASGSWGSWVGPGLPPPGTSAPVYPPAVDPTPAAPGNVKPCLDVVCGAEQSATLHALSVCLCFDNLMARAFPEWIRANTDLSMVVQARYAEMSLLSQMFTLATTLGPTLATSYGAARDMLATVRLAASQFRWSNRLEPEAPLQFVCPSWVQDAIATDLSIQQPGDMALSVSYTEIAGYFSDINVQPVWVLDGNPVAPSDVFDDYSAYGANANWLLYPTGAFTLLDGGQLDLGVVRTKEDIVRNKYCEFAETFEAVAYLGPAAPGWVVRAVTPIAITGSTSGGSTTPPPVTPVRPTEAHEGSSGQPGYFVPTGSMAANLADLNANPIPVAYDRLNTSMAAWSTGSYIVLGDGTEASKGTSIQYDAGRAV